LRVKGGSWGPCYEVTEHKNPPHPRTKYEWLGAPAMRSRNIPYFINAVFVDNSWGPCYEVTEPTMGKGLLCSTRPLPWGPCYEVTELLEQFVYR